jgi:hypothetical protein
MDSIGGDSPPGVGETSLAVVETAGTAAHRGWTAIEHDRAIGGLSVRVKRGAKDPPADLAEVGERLNEIVADMNRLDEKIDDRADQLGEDLRGTIASAWASSPSATSCSSESYANSGRRWSFRNCRPIELAARR